MLQASWLALGNTLAAQCSSRAQQRQQGGQHLQQECALQALPPPLYMRSAEAWQRVETPAGGACLNGQLPVKQ